MDVHCIPFVPLQVSIIIIIIIIIIIMKGSSHITQNLISILL